MRVSRAVVNLTRCEERVVRIIGVIAKCVKEELIRLLAYLEYLQVPCAVVPGCAWSLLEYAWLYGLRKSPKTNKSTKEKDVDQTMPHA